MLALPLRGLIYQMMLSLNFYRINSLGPQLPRLPIQNSYTLPQHSNFDPNQHNPNVLKKNHLNNNILTYKYEIKMHNWKTQR